MSYYNVKKIYQKNEKNEKISRAGDIINPVRGLQP
jgi:hypothetical protein